MRLKYFYYQFWLRSSRGTDVVTVVEFRRRPSKDLLREKLETWCQRFPAWTSSNNHMTYGYGRVRAEPRRTILRKYERACAKHLLAQRRQNLLAASLNPEPA